MSAQYTTEPAINVEPLHGAEATQLNVPSLPQGISGMTGKALLAKKMAASG